LLAWSAIDLAAAASLAFVRAGGLQVLGGGVEGAAGDRP